MLVSAERGKVRLISCAEAEMDTGRVIILRKFGRSDRNILNAICEFCSFSGVSDQSCNEKSAKLTLAH